MPCDSNSYHAIHMLFILPPLEMPPAYTVGRKEASESMEVIRSSSAGDFKYAACHPL